MNVNNLTSDTDPKEAVIAIIAESDKLRVELAELVTEAIRRERLITETVAAFEMNTIKRVGGVKGLGTNEAQQKRALLDIVSSDNTISTLKDNLAELEKSILILKSDIKQCDELRQFYMALLQHPQNES